ncbi:hypothetical protein ABIA33_007465 [Streptacidiphilus sp. MAP12-16]|uniref:hypothetical protein n=1 Tax=Streptacidiphilus sp. MAP12-16 TaxID=3156300 RepID=UPI003516F0C6
MVSLDPVASADWTSHVRRAGLQWLFTRPWGDSLAYWTLLRSPGMLAVLDAPGGWPLGELVELVRALHMLAPVTVVTPGASFREELLDAGAVNVLSREAPAKEIRARIEADIRWLQAKRHNPADDPSDSTSRLPGARAGLKESQSLLLEILLRSPQSFCCHNIRWLLGGPGEQLSLPAVRGRLNRLEPFLAFDGRILTKTHHWGRDVFRVVSLAG